MTARSATAELVRLFDRVATPIYAVNDQRQIIYVNQACQSWLNRPRAELLGLECRYHSEVGNQAALAIEAALCPPPQTFHGERSHLPALVSAKDTDAVELWIEFTPLAGSDGAIAGVLAIVQPKTSVVSAADAAFAMTQESWHTRLQRFRHAQRERHQLANLVGSGPMISRVRAQVVAAAASSASVLVIGPAGSGREHVARTIHDAQSAAATAPLVPLACPLLDAEVLQATIRSLAKYRPGESLLRASLLLTDVDELPIDTQSELLNFMRLAELPFRLVATARQSLLELRGTPPFHQELAWQLCTLLIELPPLAERLEDLPLLAQAFLEECNAQGDKQLSGFTPEALEQLAGYSWPRELDELAEVVREAHTEAAGPWIGVQNLPAKLALAAAAVRYPRKVEEQIVLEDFLAEIERELIQRALTLAKGNKTSAARLLGMTRPRLYRRLVQLGFEPDEDQPRFES